MKLSIALFLSINAALSAATLISGDTPEVAAAKAHHAAAHAAARASLPVLPQDHFNHGAPVHHVGGPVFPSVATHPQHVQRTFSQFAEEIPLSHLGETPEVAAARAHHLAEYAKVRAALPEIPGEPIHHGVHHAGHVVHNPVHIGHHEPISRGFTQFAEEIPLSPLGETPEVAAARAHHLAELARVRSILPEIPTQFGPGNLGHHHGHHVGGPVLGHNGLIDTPEVAAARAAHAAAHAAAAGLLG